MAETILTAERLAHITGQVEAYANYWSSRDEDQEFIRILDDRRDLLASHRALAARLAEATLERDQFEQEKRRYGLAAKIAQERLEDYEKVRSQLAVSQRELAEAREKREDDAQEMRDMCAVIQADLERERAQLAASQRELAEARETIATQRKDHLDSDLALRWQIDDLRTKLKQRRSDVVHDVMSNLATERVQRLAAEGREAECISLLRRFEWKEQLYNGVPVRFTCPSCGILQGMEHVDGCRLHAALAAPTSNLAGDVLAACEKVGEMYADETKPLNLDLYQSVAREFHSAVRAWRERRGTGA